MSWLARSIANSLRLDDDNNEEEEEEQNQQQQQQNHAPNAEPTTKTHSTVDPKSQTKPEPEPDPQSEPSTPTARGVKDDLSELTQTISRQFWGVASFLGSSSEPKPNRSLPEPQISDPELADEALIAGIRSDFGKISGRFKSGISKLSSNKAVSEITKIASDFLQFGNEEERPLQEFELNGVVGVTEEVVAFARNVAMHPETWLDFPLPDDPDSDDFDLSDAQQEHALAVERLAPSLAALRLELCPGYMSDGCFWKIYFVLLHPRLNKNDAVILSSPQIMEARAMLTHELDKRKKKKEEPNLFASGNVQSEEAEHHLSMPSSVQQESHPLQTSTVEAAVPMVVSDVEMDKQPIQNTEVQIIEKSAAEEAPVKPAAEQSLSSSVNKISDEMDEGDADDWLKEDTSETIGGIGTSIPTANEDDVSFSDLEEDDGEVPISYKQATPGSDSSKKYSRD